MQLSTILHYIITLNSELIGYVSFLVFTIFQIFTGVETKDERKLPVLKKSRKWQNRIYDFIKYPLTAILLNLTIFVYLGSANFELVLREKTPSFF